MARTSSLIDVLVVAYDGPNNLGEPNLMDARRVRDNTKEAGWR
jgi:hypothetical protein